MKSLLLLIFSVVLSSGADVTIHPFPGGEWTVKDDGGDVCMKMSFSATLEVFNGDKPTQYNIDQSFAASGICAKPFRQFTLTSPDPTRTIIKELQLTFLFDHTRDIYTMPQIMAVWFDTIHTEYWEKDMKQDDNLLNETVEQSKSYKCNRDLQFFLQGGYGSVFMWNIELVPFIEDYHYQAQECTRATKNGQDCSCQTLKVLKAFLGVFVVIAIGFSVAFIVCLRCYFKKSGTEQTNTPDTTEHAINSGTKQTEESEREKLLKNNK